jgi:hypothetical protein
MIKLVSSSSDSLCKKLVVVDGIPGCGKTMLSAIVSSLSNIEMLKYSYEIEIYCHLHDLKVLDLDNSSQLIKNQLDFLIYNSMMGREMNFRYSDISSVFKSRNKIENIRRIFSAGDETVPQKIINSKPILHLATHGLSGIAAPLFNAMPKGMLFIHMLRHPFFLLRQNIWNMSNLINNPRSFWLYYDYEGHSYPSFYLGRESLLTNANPKEKAIYFIEWFINKRASNLSLFDKENYYELTFESLVQDPYTHIDEICSRLDIQQTSYTKKVLRREKIPRIILSDGREREIYKRVGWVKSNTKNLADEFEEHKRWAFDGISDHAAETLSKMCNDYGGKYQTV